MARAGSLFHTPDDGVYLRAIDWRTWGENVGYMPGGCRLGPSRLHGQFHPWRLHPESHVPTRGDRVGARRGHAVGDGLLLPLTRCGSSRPVRVPSGSPRDLDPAGPIDPGHPSLHAG